MAGRVEISAGAAFLGALLLLLLRNEELIALLLPVTVHELGHLTAILALGQRVTGFRAGFGGFTIDYAGNSPPAGHALIAAAGPLAGLAYAWAASRLGSRWDSDWLCLSAGLSLLLSLFNLLPVLPLDGGQLFSVLACAVLGEERGRRLCAWAALPVAAALIAAGTVLLLRRKGAALLLAGLWLFWRALWEQGLVKIQKIR